MKIRDIIIKTYRTSRGWVGKKLYLTYGSTSYGQSIVKPTEDEASRAARDLTWKGKNA